MDPFLFKIVIVIGAASVLFFLARVTSRVSESGPAPATIPQPELVPLMPKTPAKIGSELPFPFDVRELSGEFPDFDRPNILNYYFRETDFETGPANPTSFCDEFFIDLEDPKSGDRWTDSYIVATPDGIKAVMAEEHKKFMCCNKTIMVASYDLGSILRAVLQSYAEAQSVEGDNELTPPESNRYSG